MDICFLAIVEVIVKLIENETRVHMQSRMISHPRRLAVYFHSLSKLIEKTCLHREGGWSGRGFAMGQQLILFNYFFPPRVIGLGLIDIFTGLCKLNEG